MSNARNLANLLGTSTQVKTAKVADEVFQANESLIINGDMAVNQRASSVTGVGSSSGYFVQDRWNFFTFGSAAARWTQSTSTDVPASSTFASSMKLECTTASGTVAAGNRQQFMQIIEAQDLQHLKYGSSNAKELTVSFWVKSSVTGKNYCWLYHYDGVRFSYKSYTINSANTWEYKTLTFSGDTVSAITDDNGQGLALIWMLYVGSDYSSATDGVENTWAAWSSGNYDQFNGQVNNADTIGNSWYLTGVKLEVGSVSTPYRDESYAENLAKCQRYYVQQTAHIQTPTGGSMIVPVYFPTTMRSTPTTSNVAAGSGGTGLTSENIAGLHTQGAYFQVASSANSNYRINRIDEYVAEL